jgi:hypothetical protein
MHPAGAKPTIFTKVKNAELCFANPPCVFQDRLEHWLQVAGRRADDAQYIRCCSLLLQRLAQLIEQPRVLDSDDGLGGKIFNELDLFLGEGADFLASSLSIGTVT